MPLVLLRGVPCSFELAVSDTRPANSPRPDPQLAKAAHDELARIVADAAGDELVNVLPPDDMHPDCCFVQDTGVFLTGKQGSRHFVVCPSRNPSRMAEATIVRDIVAKRVPEIEIHQLPKGAFLEGGDVIFFGRTMLIGYHSNGSGRTNQAGYVFLENLATSLGYKVFKVNLLGNCLHLTSVASGIGPTANGEQWLLYNREHIVPPSVSGIDFWPVPKNEGWAANVLWLPFKKPTAVVQKGNPGVLAQVREIADRSGNITVAEVDCSQFELAQGSLTCLAQILLF